MRLNDFFDRIVVINLERRTDRLEAFDKQAQELGFTYQVKKAIDGKAVGIDPIVAGRLTHIEVLQSMAFEEKVLIMEDDAQFDPDFAEKFPVYMERLPDDWDMFYLGAIKNQTLPVNDYWVKQVVSTGAQAYCPHPSKRDLWVQAANAFDKWIDVAYRLYAHKTNCYIAQPNLVIQTPGYSDLRCVEVRDFKGFQ